MQSLVFVCFEGSLAQETCMIGMSSTMTMIRSSMMQNLCLFYSSVPSLGPSGGWQTEGIIVEEVAPLIRRSIPTRLLRKVGGTPAMIGRAISVYARVNWI
ncbi:hypothetical protein BJX70DRAFT_367568 [Aspergillus crustosus]